MLELLSGWRLVDLPGCTPLVSPDVPYVGYLLVLSMLLHAFLLYLVPESGGEEAVESPHRAWWQLSVMESHGDPKARI